MCVCECHSMCVCVCVCVCVCARTHKTCFSVYIDQDVLTQNVMGHKQAGFPLIAKKSLHLERTYPVSTSVTVCVSLCLFRSKIFVYVSV